MGRGHCIHIWNGIRTRVARVKGASPRPLDDPDFSSALAVHAQFNTAYTSWQDKFSIFFVFSYFYVKTRPIQKYGAGQSYH